VTGLVGPRDAVGPPPGGIQIIAHEVIYRLKEGNPVNTHLNNVLAEMAAVA
jgi:hypothetical protein